MLSRVKTLALVAILAAASGCSVSGNVTFNLSFNGSGCIANSAVKTIRITIPGQTLENQGVYNCSEQVLLLNFASGGYAYTAEAFGASNERLFIKQGNFNVNGNVTVNVNLAAADELNSYAYLTWRFPPVGTSTVESTCAQAGIMYVDYAIDSGQAVRTNCVDGQTQSGTPTAALRPGNHTIQLDGLGSTGTRYFSKTGTLVVNPGNAIAADFRLDWAVGGSALAWGFFDAGAPVSCASTGVAQVRVNFRRGDGSFVFGAAGDLQPCGAASAFYYLEAGVYSVVVDAQGAAGRVYSTNTTTPPLVTITTAGFTTTPQLLRLDRI